MSLAETIGRRVRSPWRAEGVAVAGGCAILIVLLIKLANDSMTLSILAIGATLLLAVLTCLGLERTGIAMIFLAMFFAPMNAIGPSAAASFVTFADLFFFLGFAMLLPTIIHRPARFPMLYLGGAFVVVVIGAVVSINASSPATSLNLLARLIISGVGLPIAFMWWRPDWRLTGFLAGSYALGVIVSTAYGVLFAGSSLAQGVGHESRYAGLTEQPNELGLTGLLGVALVPFIVKVMPPTHRWFWWCVGAVNVGAIWISGSRAALLVLVVLAVIYPTLEKSAKAAGWLTLGGTIGLALSGKLLNSNGTDTLSRLLGGGSATASDQARTDAINAALAEFRMHPIFGSGFEDTLATHVIYLEILVSVGVVGVVGYLFMLGSGTHAVFTAPRPLNRLAYPVLAYVMVGLLTPALWDRYIWAVLALSFLVATPQDAEAVAAAEAYGRSTKAGPDQARTTRAGPVRSGPIKAGPTRPAPFKGRVSR